MQTSNQTQAQSTQNNRIVLVGGLAPSMFGYKELLIRYKKISTEELKELAKDAEVINFIRHESTVKLLSSILKKEMPPNSGLYTWREGDVLVIVGLKKPIRGQEVEVKPEDLELVLCRISPQS